MVEDGGERRRGKMVRVKIERKNYFLGVNLLFWLLIYTKVRKGWGGQSNRKTIYNDEK